MNTMDPATRSNFENLWSTDLVLQNEAFQTILQATEIPVDWAYEVWDDLIEGLSHKDNHVRAIAAQVLCNLAKSDPNQRMLQDFSRLLAITKDQRFVTARHCLQALWKVGVAGKEQQSMVVAGLSGRYVECITEKNSTLIRYDILVALRNLYDAVQDDSIREQAKRLIALEEDLKYRKKYAGAWR
jgi:HEAT repeat protein